MWFLKPVINNTHGICHVNHLISHEVLYAPIFSHITNNSKYNEQKEKRKKLHTITSLENQAHTRKNNKNNFKVFASWRMLMTRSFGEKNLQSQILITKPKKSLKHQLKSKNIQGISNNAWRKIQNKCQQWE